MDDDADCDEEVRAVGMLPVVEARATMLGLAPPRPLLIVEEREELEAPAPGVVDEEEDMMVSVSRAPYLNKE